MVTCICVDTVPVLWDTQTSTIVNNESSEIMRMLYREFDAWSSVPGLTFYPANLAAEIDAVNDWVYDAINNGCGFIFWNWWTVVC